MHGRTKEAAPVGPGTASRLALTKGVGTLMLPGPIPPLSWRNRRNSPPPSAFIWVTPWLFIAPMMVAVGFARVIAPKSKDDWDRYLRALSALLTESLSKAVEYRTAGQSRHRCNAPTRDRTRPTGAVRPGNPGGPRATGRGRVKR